MGLYIGSVIHTSCLVPTGHDAKKELEMMPEGVVIAFCQSSAKALVHLPDRSATSAYSPCACGGFRRRAPDCDVSVQGLWDDCRYRQDVIYSV